MVLENHETIKGSPKRYNYSKVMIPQQTTEQTTKHNTTGSNPRDDGEKRPEPILIELLYTKEELDEYYKGIGKVRHKESRRERYETLIEMYQTDLRPESKNINLTNIPNLEKRREELEYHIHNYSESYEFRWNLTDDEDEFNRLERKLEHLKLEFYPNSKYRIYQRNYSIEHKEEEKKYNKRYYEENKEFLKEYNKDNYNRRLQRLEKFTEELTLGTLEKTTNQMTIEELGIYIKHYNYPIKNLKRKTKKQLLDELNYMF